MAEPVRILIVEDMPEDQELVLRALRKSGIAFESRIVETEKGLGEALSSGWPQVVLSDFTLPSFDGMRALRQVKAADSSLPFILVTGSLDEETAVQVMKSGADDYILKDRIVRLPAATLAALKMRAAREDKSRAEEALRVSEVALARARSLEAMGMIAGGVAHEVRNPLNALQIMAAVLEKKQGDDPDVRQCVFHIREQVQRLSILMKDLLELGRPVEPEEFSLCNLALVLREVVDNLAAVHEGARARIFVESPEDPVNILGSPNRLMQVFANLLHNALSLSEDGAEVKVEITLNGETVAMRVRDRGPGIPHELLPRLFRPFQSQRKGGTGLGLAIVQKVVMDHGGTVEAVNNDPPPGATFTVRLPLAQ